MSVGKPSFSLPLSAKPVVDSLEPVAGDDVGAGNGGLPFGCANRIVCLAGSKTPGCGVGCGVV